MSAAALVALLRRRYGPPATDADLLRAYTAHRDGDAFRRLVERHGPLVLRLCRRLLDDAHAADDAFQAVFLTLARQAGSVRRPEALAAWLYGAARRVCANARAASDRRRQAESSVRPRTPPNPIAELSARELFDVLDAELDRLPERHRLPLLLVYWQGLTHAEAARRLGLTPAALHGRLDRGRATLAERLARRGFAPGDWSALLAAPLAVIVPRDLVAATAGLAADPWSKSIPVTVLALAVANGSAKLVSAVVLGILCASAGLIVLAGSGAWRAGSVSDRSSEQQPPVAHAPGSPADAQPNAAGMDAFGDPLPAGALARLGTVRLRPGYMQFLAVTPDGRSVMTGEFDGLMRWWDVQTGREHRRHEFVAPNNVGNDDLCAVAYTQSPDGKTLATVQRSMSINVRSPIALVLSDAATGRTIRRIEIETTNNGWPPEGGRDILFQGLAFSADGRWVAVGTQTGTVGIWEVTSGQERLRFRVSGRVLALALSFDGGRVAVCNNERTVEVRDTARNVTRSSIQLQRGEEVADLAFAPDGQTLALAVTGNSAIIVLWDVVAGKQVKRLIGNNARQLHSIAYTPDGRTLAATTYREVVLWDIASGLPRVTIPAQCRHLAVTPDGKTLATAAGSVRFWDIATGQERHTLAAAHFNDVQTLTFAPDGRIVTSDGADVRFWDARTGRHLQSMAGPRGRSIMAVSPDGTLAACAEFPGTTQIWDLARGRELVQLKNTTTNGWWSSLVFGRDGRTIVGWGPDDGLHGWDLPEGTERFHHATIPLIFQRLGDAHDPATVARFHFAHALHAFSADGTRFAVATDRGTTIWDVPTGRELWHIDALTVESPGQRASIALSPNGRLLIAFLPKRGEVVAWEIATGQIVAAMKNESSCDAVAVGLDCRTLATSERLGDRTFVRIRDLLAEKELVRFNELGGPNVHQLAISPNGALLTAALSNTTALVWDLAPHRRPAAAVPPLSDEVLQAYWRDLGDVDAAKARAAVWALTDAAGNVSAFLRDRLRPAVRPSEDHLRKLIADLDSPRFAARAEAEKDLTALADLAAPALGRALAGTPSLEVRQRVEKLLKALEPPVTNAELLRQIRAVEVLEHVGTLAAREALQRLAEGASDARMTHDAKASLERLRRPK